MPEEKAQMTPEEIAANPRTAEIHKTLKTLIELCQVEPMVSIICSVAIPSENAEDEHTIASIYFGNQFTQVNQIQCLADKTPAFIEDLKVFLANQIEAQMKTHGTSGNTLADRMLAQMADSKDEIIH